MATEGMVESAAPADDTQEKIDAVESRIDPRNDYTSFLGADDYQAAHKPGEEKLVEPKPKAEAKPKAEPKAKAEAKDETPEMPTHLVEMARTLGFEEDEIAEYKGDAASLTRTMSHLLKNRNVPDPDEDEDDDEDTPLAAEGKRDDGEFDLERFLKGKYENSDPESLYDEGVVRLAKDYIQLKNILKEVLPPLQQFMQEHRREKARSVWEADLKEAGVDTSILDNKDALTKAVMMIGNLQKTYREMGATPPKPSELWKAVLPLVGATGSSPPQTDDRPAGQKKDGAPRNRLAEEQKAALDKNRNPLNGQFVGEPTHRGSQKINGDPLRTLLVDHGIDPGAEPVSVSKDQLGFLQ